MVVIVRVNDDNYDTTDCFVANSIASAMEFIAKDTHCDESGDSIDDYEVPQEQVMSRNCRVWDFDDGLIYRVHLCPEQV